MPKKSRNEGEQTHGIDAKAFKDLLRLLKMCPPFSPPDLGDRRDRKRPPLSNTRAHEVVKLADRIVETTGCEDLSQVVETVVKNGFPESTQALILDRYRKSSYRRHRMESRYGKLARLTEGMTKEDIRIADSIDMTLDSVAREGRPAGPRVLEGSSEEVEAIGEALDKKSLAAKAQGLDNALAEHRNACQEMAKILSEAKKRAITSEMVAHVRATLSMITVRREDLAGLRGIAIYVPLDHDIDLTKKDVEDIVLRWRGLRSEAGFTGHATRQRAKAQKKQMLGLPARIELLREALQTDRGIFPGAQNGIHAPDIENIADPGPTQTEDVDELAELIASELSASHSEVTKDTAMAAVQAALDRLLP